MIEIVECEPKSRHQAKLCDLEYGTVLRTSCQPNSLYMKVNKRKCSQNTSISFPKHHCVLMNLKLGTIRDMPGDKIVTVFDTSVHITPTNNISQHKKDCY